MLPAALLALVAAFFFALASVLQQRAASEVPDEDALKAGLMTRLLRQPLWLLGVGSAALAYVVQAVALGIGSLIVVQPLLVTMLLFALPLGARFAGRRLAPTDWAWAILLTTGLAGFLLVGDPTQGVDRAEPARWAVALVVLYPIVAVLVGSATVRRGATRALLLGSAAGILFGTSDGLTKAVVRGLDEGIGPTLRNWELLALVVSITTGFFFQQSAYQAGGLRASLPAITGLEPITGILLGVFVYHERFRVESLPGRVVLALTAIAAVSGALALARSAGRQEHLGPRSDASASAAAGLDASEPRTRTDRVRPPGEGSGTG